MFKWSEISALQPLEISEVLMRWRQDAGDKFSAAAQAYDASPSVAGTKLVGQLHSIDQLFVTTIPALRAQRPGWQQKLEELLAELRRAEMLDDA